MLKSERSENFVEMGKDFSLAKSSLLTKNYGQSKSLFEKCLRNHEKQLDLIKQTQIYFNLSICHFYLKETAESLECIKKSEKILKSALINGLFERGQYLKYVVKSKFNKIIIYLVLCNFRKYSSSIDKLAHFVSNEEGDNKLSLIKSLIKQFFIFGVFKSNLKKQTIQGLNEIKKEMKSLPISISQSKFLSIFSGLMTKAGLVNLVKLTQENFQETSEKLINVINDEKAIEFFLQGKIPDPIKKQIFKLLDTNSTKNENLVQSEKFLQQIIERVNFVKEFFKKIETILTLSNSSLNITPSKSSLGEKLPMITSPAQKVLKMKFILSPPVKVKSINTNINEGLVDQGTNTPSSFRNGTKTGTNFQIIHSQSKSINVFKSAEIAPMKRFSKFEEPSKLTLKKEMLNINESPKVRISKITVNDQIDKNEFYSFQNKFEKLEDSHIKNQRRSSSLKRKIDHDFQDSVKFLKINQRSNSTKDILIHSNKYDMKTIYENLLEFYQKSYPSEKSFNLNITNTVERYYVGSKAGRNERKTEKINQDSTIAIENFLQIKNLYLFGICDGHGEYGHNASQQVKISLPANIHLLELNRLLLDKNNSFPKNSKSFIKEFYEKNHKNIPLFKSNLKEFASDVRDSFVKTHEDLQQIKKFNFENSGTTCCTVIIHGKNLYCFNVGDSRAVIGKNSNEKWVPIYLSVDHKPDREEEKQRIIESNGRVEPFKDEEGSFFGPNRVWLKDKEMPGLAVSRSIGDFIASSVGVSQEPEIFEYRIMKSDKFLILASDGVWEFISNEKAVEIVGNCLDDGNQENAVEELIKVARNEWEKNEIAVDDISVIVVYFDTSN